MKNKDKIVIAILDQGVFPWWNDVNSELAENYAKYFSGFEMEYKDFADNGNDWENYPAGSHGFWVLDRLLQVCGSQKKIKIINCKVFSNLRYNSDALHNALEYVTSEGVDLVNLSIGIPRYARLSSEAWLEKYNELLNGIVDQNGFTIISGGNEGERLSNGAVIDNSNIMADDPYNNISVGSHDKDGYWDSFSSAGGTIDVSTIGSNLNLLGEREIESVSGTSFSAPTFSGICANYLIDQFTNLRSGEKSSKDIIYGHLHEAIPPTFGAFRRFLNRGERSAWYGQGSFESYAKFFIEYYERDVLQHSLFNTGNEETEVLLKTM